MKNMNNSNLERFVKAQELMYMMALDLLFNKYSFINPC